MIVILSVLYVCIGAPIMLALFSRASKRTGNIFNPMLFMGCLMFWPAILGMFLIDALIVWICFKLKRRR